MTKETLEHANKVLKELRSERDHLEYLTNIVETTGEASNRTLFEISASIVSTHYRRNTFISPEVAEMALNKEIENTTKRIALESDGGYTGHWSMVAFDEIRDNFEIIYN